MIQRIQTIYLLIATIVLGLMFIPLSIGTTNPTSEGIFSDGIFNLYDNKGLMALNIIPMADYLIAIFLFTNRKLQMILASIGSLLSSAFAGVCAYIVTMDSAQIALGAHSKSLGSLYKI